MPAQMMPAHRRIIVAGSVGNFIEWYEFAVYGFMAPIIARHFFQLPDERAGTSIILTWAAFAVAFFFRPLGAIIFGRLGDRRGRKPVLIGVLIMMTLVTTAIGLVPDYAAIGLAAPLMLTLLRILQGLFAGGEYGGAVSLMTEAAPPGKRGLYGAWQSLTVACGLLAGAATVALIPLLIGEEAMFAWGWRLPFLLALPLGGAALWLRAGLDESPQFNAARQAPAPERASFTATLRAIALAISRLMVWSAAGYTYLVIMPTYLQTTLHTGFNQALLIAVISNLGFAATILPAGWLAERSHRQAYHYAGCHLYAADLRPSAAWGIAKSRFRLIDESAGSLRSRCAGRHAGRPGTRHAGRDVSHAGALHRPGFRLCPVKRVIFRLRRADYFRAHQTDRKSGYSGVVRDDYRID